MTTTRTRLQELLDYAFHRIAVYLGAREAHFVTFIQAGARIDGWLAVEAFYALTRPAISQAMPGVRLAGPTQGQGPHEPDLLLPLGERSLTLSLKSLPLTAERPLGFYFTSLGEVPAAFVRLTEKGPDSALVLVAYPLRMDDPQWTETVAAAEKAHPVQCLKSLQFPLPGPQRVTLSLWRPL